MKARIATFCTLILLASGASWAFRHANAEAGANARVTAPATPVAPAAAAVAAPTAASPGPSAGAFTADPAHSVLGFTGLQAGADFKGTFGAFTAHVVFDPAHLGGSRIEVQIETRSVDTQDGERDSTIRSADFFDAGHFPQATYVTRSISPSPTGYSALGTLTLRGKSRDVPIAFTFSRTAAGATLSGNALIKRLDFGVGQGEWQDTKWVGNEVRINFSLSLRPAL